MERIRPRRSTSARWLLAALAAVAAIAPLPSRAGTGTKTGSKLNLRVMFLYDEKDYDSWKPVFTEASKLLWNATEGNLQFGDICFTTGCEAAKDRADIWIRPGTGGASAHVSGLGTSGRHVFLSTIHKRNDATAHGQFGMVHELGHYVLGLADEYGGRIWTEDQSSIFAPPAGQYMWRNDNLNLGLGSPVFYCSTASGGSSCIMDGGTTVTTAFSRTEFCSNDHVTGRKQSLRMPGEAAPQTRYVRNNQDATAGGSCWSVIAPYLGVAAPAAPGTAMPAGHQDVSFADCGGAQRYVLVLDRSGSMCDASKIDLAKAAARSFVDLAHLHSTDNSTGSPIEIPGDELGVVSFDCTPSLDYPLQEMISADTRNQAKSAIDGMYCGGTTSIGGGLNLALGQLRGRGDPGCSESIILLSDGQQNCGTEIDEVLPELVSRKAAVYTIGVGYDADTSTLSGIASATGGAYFFAASAGDLPGVFARIQAMSSGSGVVDSVKKHLEAGASETLSIPIEAGATSATFAVYGAGLTAMLVTPSGQVIPPLPANVEYTEDRDFRLFRVTNPAAGTWKVSLTASSAVDYTLTASAASPAISVGIDPLPSTVAAPAPIIARVTVLAGAPVVGASVTGVVKRPQGSDVAVTFYDDGAAAHGDETAGDGIYSTAFSSYNADGVYTLNITAQNSTGTLAVDEYTPGAAPEVAPPFRRTLTVSTEVYDVPSLSVAWGILSMPQVLNAGASQLVISDRGQKLYQASSPSTLLQTRLPLTNTGPTAIPAGALNVHYRWLSTGGATVSQGTYPLDAPEIASGATIRPLVRFSTPTANGAMRLELTATSASGEIAQTPATANITFPAPGTRALRPLPINRPVATPAVFVPGNGRKVTFTSRIYNTNVDVILGEWDGTGLGRPLPYAPTRAFYAGTVSFGTVKNNLFFTVKQR